MAAAIFNHNITFFSVKHLLPKYAQRDRYSFRERGCAVRRKLCSSKGPFSIMHVSLERDTYLLEILSD